MKFFKILGVVALAMLISASMVYAETQSVKVSGDIALRSFARDNYSLNTGRLNPTSPAAGVGAVGAAETGTRSNSWDTFLLSTAEVQVEADLTDNVSGVIRLLNQRTWGDGNAFSGGNAMAVKANAGNAEIGYPNAPWPNRSIGTAVNPGSGAAFDVLVDLAYIELKEFLYSPLTLKIGRQDLWFGKGFIIGANQQLPQNELLAPEYTELNAFDAIRATLDYDPWTIDAVFAKIQENAMGADDDYNLWGANIGYVFNQYNAEAEGYWWYKQRRYEGGVTAAGVLASPVPNTIAVSSAAHTNDVYTLGGRGSIDPIEDWTIAGEVAYQWGEYMGANAQGHKRGRSAWALDIDVECRYFQDQYAWKPVLGAEYIFYSGETNMAGQTIDATASGTYTGWDPMFRGKFDTKIREWQNVYYLTDMASSPANTNQHQMLFRGSIEPMDSVTIDATYGYFWLANDWATDTTTFGPWDQPMNEERDLGQELDLEATWDYTEDVSFGFLAAWFFPGKHFSGQGSMRDVAADLVGTVKLSF